SRLPPRVQFRHHGQQAADPTNGPERDGRQPSELQVCVVTAERIPEAAAPAGTGRGVASGPILRTEELTMRFGGLTAVNRVSIAVERGEIRAIIGPNGAGKSTFFNCITGVLKPTS